MSRPTSVHQPGHLTSALTTKERLWSGVVNGRHALNQSPLRSSAISFTPCLKSIALTTSALADTVMLLRGGMLIPESTLGESSDLLVVPTAASPLKMNGEALSMRRG